MADNRGLVVNEELFDLPIEIGAHIGKNLPDEVLVAYSLSCLASQNFFAIALDNKIKSKLIEFVSWGMHDKIQQILTEHKKYLNNDQLMLSLLLHMVAFGQETQAQALLNLVENPGRLLSMKGTVTDYAGNTFEDITVLQYVIWALDRHMWQMLLPYMTKEEVARQLKEHLSEIHPPEYVKAHGKHFNFAPILLSYTKFNQFAAEIDWMNFVEDSADGVKLSNDWQTIVSLQHKLPVHVINEFCYPGRSFADALNAVEPFNENELPRVTTTDLRKRLHIIDESECGLIRANRNGGCLFLSTAAFAKDYTPLDYDAICQLQNKRICEFADLINRHNIIPEVKQSHPLPAHL